MSILSNFVAAALVALCLVFAPPNAIAQETATDISFQLELNAAAETTQGSCRLTYVVTNQSDIALDRTAYEVAVFDSNGVVNRLLVLEFGSLISGKTKILQFDLSETPCGSISRIVVNDVAGCTRADSGEASDLCMSGLTTSSRTAIQFGI